MIKNIQHKNSERDYCPTCKRSLSIEYKEKLEWLDSEDFCSRYKISKGTLANWRSYGKIPYRKRYGKILYLKSEIDNFFLSNKKGVIL